MVTIDKGVTVNDLVVYRYEKQPSDFRVGELVHNFNGNDYRVMENYGGGDVLLIQMNTGMFVVAEGIEAYKRYPKDDMPTAENTRTGIEWGSGVYTFPQMRKQLEKSEADTGSRLFISLKAEKCIVIERSSIGR